MSELLAMLTPGAPPMSLEVKGTSGKRITPGDVAACMVHVDRHTYLYALSKYCLDDNSRTELNALAIANVKGLGYVLTENEPEDAVERLGLMRCPLLSVLVGAGTVRARGRLRSATRLRCARSAAAREI